MAASKSDNRPSYGQYSPPPENSGHKRKSLAALFCVSLALWLGVLAIGVVIGLGCINNDGLFIVRLSSNHSSAIEVSLGYAGTCVKTINASACISHVAYEGDDAESIAEQFQRELDGHQNNNNNNNSNNNTAGTGTGTGIGTPLTNGTNRISFKDAPTSRNANDTSLDMTTLKALLSITSNLQNDVFPLGAPLGFLALFALGTVILWCLLPSPTGTRTYKAVLAGAILLSSYGLTLGFMVALATRQACAGLVVLPRRDGWGGGGVVAAADDIYVYVVEGEALQTLQWVVVAVAAVLQACVAWLFVQRRAAGDDVQVSVLPTVVNNISFTKTRRCCCCF
ncbi:hypothetical protein F5B21DRAFT_501438 [Xylaria acuta]|nr:hypothetical protein F5B21DRAFT_501438 [Xylaria acuta]